MTKYTWDGTWSAPGYGQYVIMADDKELEPADVINLLENYCDLTEQVLNTSAFCNWQESWDMWEGECGASWNLTEGTPIENNMFFCPKCGRRLLCPTPTPEDWP